MKYENLFVPDNMKHELIQEVPGYTHRISFYKKVSGHGWLFHDFRTTKDAVQTHMKSLKADEKSGKVRMLEVIEL